MRNFIATFCLAALVVFTAGCTSTGDPYEDSIGFSRARHEREYMQPGRERLAAERQSAEAEQIRGVTLRQTLARDQAHGEATEARLRAARVQLATAKGQLAELDRQVDEAGSGGAEERGLVSRRDRAQEEVDRLTEIVENLLKTH